MRKTEKPNAVWCKDCKWYHKASDGMACVNSDSDWCADYPPEHCSCEYCEEREGT